MQVCTYQKGKIYSGLPDMVWLHKLQIFMSVRSTKRIKLQYKTQKSIKASGITPELTTSFLRYSVKTTELRFCRSIFLVSENKIETEKMAP